MGEEYVGIVGGKMKFVNTNRTGDGEGKPLCTYTCYFREECILKEHSKLELLFFLDKR
jgi:hypothetical protein